MALEAYARRRMADTGRLSRDFHRRSEIGHRKVKRGRWSAMYLAIESSWAMT